MKKEKVPFGQRKSNTSFGKVPSKGSFGKKPSKPLKSKDTSTIKLGIKEKATTPKFGMVKATLSHKSINNIISKEDKEYLDWLHQEEQGYNYHCFVCGNNNSSDTTEWHHVKKGSGAKKDHKRQIPLCGNEHHRLGTVMSAHGTPKKFRETYPMEVQYKYADKIYSDFLQYKKNALYLEV